MMLVLKLEIAKKAKGRILEDEDWWRLCYDTQSQEFFVEHEWNYLVNGIRIESGTEHHMISETWKFEGGHNLEHAQVQLLEEAEKLQRLPVTGKGD